ncbi:MAG: proteasome subunit alpha [Ilumatobacteraceae bacterium]
MSMPFYVPPEQMMKEKADFARKGIARGRALIALQFVDGIVLVAENPSNNLRKISEIYDRIAFAGVGKYNEFDQLRILGVRHADLVGYQFSRRDVEGRSLANQYAQIMGQAFTHEAKPLEVEILIAEIGADASRDRLFHITYDGTVMDESTSCILGGDTESISARLMPTINATATLSEAVRIATAALAGPDRTLTASDLEVATLTRGNHRRCFTRVDDSAIEQFLQEK